MREKYTYCIVGVCEGGGSITPLHFGPWVLSFYTLVVFETSQLAVWKLIYISEFLAKLYTSNFMTLNDIGATNTATFK